MTQEELTKKIIEAVCKVMSENCVPPDKGFECIVSATVSILCTAGKALGLNPTEFTADLLRQTIEQITHK